MSEIIRTTSFIRFWRRSGLTEVYCIYSTPELSGRIFCDGLEMKLTSSLGWIQQVGAPETATKSLLLVFICG